MQVRVGSSAGGWEGEGGAAIGVSRDPRVNLRRRKFMYTDTQTQTQTQTQTHSSQYTVALLSSSCVAILSSTKPEVSETSAKPGSIFSSIYHIYHIYIMYLSMYLFIDASCAIYTDI